MVPPLPRYYEATPTSCRPSRLASFPSLFGTAAAPWASLPPAQGAAPCGPGVIDRLPLPVRATETTGPPRFLEDPLMNVPCSSTPAESSRSATAARRCCLPLSRQCRLPRLLCFRGSITRPTHSLSTLRRMNYSIATQDSLPDGWPAFPGGTDFPLGPNERFQVNLPPSPGFAWRTGNDKCDGSTCKGTYVTRY